VRKQGVVNYIKHFMGPVWWLAWLMMPIEIISHLARPLSLSSGSSAHGGRAHPARGSSFS